jgi:hypothetical protein
VLTKLTATVASSPQVTTPRELLTSAGAAVDARAINSTPKRI